MNSEQNKKLIEQYPFLAMKEYDPQTGTFHIANDEDYTMTWLDCMPKGWKKAFGEKLCQELKEALDEFNYTDKYTVIQVKEKYGSLRWYDNGIPKGCRAWDVAEKYENISYHTCCMCGEPATKISRGWICPYCDECATDPHETYDDIGCDDGRKIYKIDIGKLPPGKDQIICGTNHETIIGGLVMGNNLKISDAEFDETEL